MPGKRFAALVVAAILLGALTLAPPLASVAQAQGGSIVYNLYATDGYVLMADGSPAYMFGFIGGRAGTTFTYQTSPCTGDGATRNCSGSENETAVAVAPMAGPTQEAGLAGHAQFPAPIIYARVGDVVEIHLKNLGAAANPNAPNDPHSIHLHGLDVDAANDGVPETSVGAVPANLCDNGTTDPHNSGCVGFVNPEDGSVSAGYAPGAGNVVVYMFTPKQAGTYMYHCHQEANIHVNMGMYGALVVYNPVDAAADAGPGQGLGGTLGGFQYDKDYVMLVSEFDVRGHASEEGTYVPDGLSAPATWDPYPYNWALYQPQYWFVNGLSFPQTIHGSFPSQGEPYDYDQWLEAHPGYETLYTGSVSKWNKWWGTPGEKVLLRVINMGFETQPLHMHGYHGKIIGSDQRVWDWANKITRNRARPFNEGLEKNTLTIGSGETYEWLVDFGQQSFNSVYPGGTQSCYDPNTGAPVDNGPNCTPIPDYVQGPYVPQYFPFHNHDDYKATNNGEYPGGMFTMLVPTE